MPIKKSQLEQKWYYRVVKVFFILLPFLFAAVMFWRLKNNFLSVVQENIFFIFIALALYVLILSIIWKIVLYIAFGGVENDTLKKAPEVPAPVKAKNDWVGPFVLFIIIIIIFILFQSGNVNLSNVNLSTRIYGTTCTNSEGKTGLYGTNGNCLTCSAGSSAVTEPVNNCSDGIAGVYCCTNNRSTSGGNSGSGSKCIPTGCGKLWSCFGTYYLDGRQISVNGCFPVSLGGVYSSWSGTCRQCP